MIRISLGNVGCLTGDSMINVNRCKKGSRFRIDYMHMMYHNNFSESIKKKTWNMNHKTYVRSYDGKRVRLHPIKDVVYSGKKEVYNLRLEDGKELNATKDHKILTDKGFVKLNNLKEGDNVMCDTLKPQKGKQKSFKLRDIYVRVLYHPFKKEKGKVGVHILSYEAYDNGMNFIDYLDVLWNDEEKAKTLRYVNPSKYHIHHKNGNHYDNSIENLEKLHIDEHLFIHSNAGESFKNFNFGIPIPSKIKEINYVGIKSTYDIVCEDPYHNFVANGIIVHNSGKTACEVREMYMNIGGRKTYSNIITKKLPNNIKISTGMIIKKTLLDYKKKKDGSSEPIYKLELNSDFWRQIKEPINVVIDEAHSVVNPRRAMSKVNIIMTDFLALIRRVLGQTSSGYGEMVFITQLPRRIDPIAREMAHQIRYHICHYLKKCGRCGCTWPENSEMPEGLFRCPSCDSSSITKFGHQVEVWRFKGMQMFEMWKNFGEKTFYKHYIVKDIEKYFKLYDTFQWSDMFSDLYD